MLQCLQDTAPALGSITKLALVLALVAAPVSSEEQPPDWDTVSAIFQARCLNCHSGPKAARHLWLDSYEGALLGSDKGVVLVAGDVAGSELIRRIRGDSTPRMPFLGPALPTEEVDLITRWVEVGLPRQTGAHKAADSGARQPPD